MCWEVVHEFTYILGSTIAENLSLEAGLNNKRIGRAATTLSKLTNRVWNKLTVRTKMQVYKACHQYAPLRQ